MRMTSPAALACAFGVSFAATASAAPLTVYDDALRNGFADWSWGVGTFGSGSPVHGGTGASPFEPDGWTGLLFHRDAGLELATYEALELCVRGGGTGGQLLTVAI